MTNQIQQAALKLHDAGISVIPTLPGGEKKPALPWKPFTQQRPTRGQVEAWFANPADDHGLAAISGEVSGNLIMIEVEGRATTKLPQLGELAQAAGLGNIWKAVNLGWLEQSPTGGSHWFVRCTQPVPGNQKLARNHDGLVVAETRGANGYTIVAPTPGTHHETGNPWQNIVGGPDTAPILTPEELSDFLNLFRSLDETPPAPVHAPTFPNAPESNRLQPGDDYEARTSWDEILLPHQWTKVFTQGQTTHWRRPGKNTGTSATTGHASDRDRIFVFSSSTDFPQEIPVTKFGAYALLEHGGDHSAAAKELAAQGYGDKLQDVQMDLSNLQRPTFHIIEGNNEPSQELTTTDGANALNLHPHVSHSGDFTEASAGRFIADAFHQQIKYITDSDRWLCWDGTKWEPTGKANAPIKQLTIQAIEALPMKTKEELAYRKKLLNSSGINSTLTLAATDPRITIRQEKLDSHHGELNTPGGIVNLHTGHLQPPNPARLHTRSTEITPQNQPTPMWDKFLAETFQGHPGIAEYMQQLAGYSATGYVRAQILPFLHGPGANGKSVLAEVLQRLLHDYAEPAPANFLMVTQTQHPTEIARLQGARLVVANEVPENARFDEEKVKRLTGGDTLTARYMHGDFFTFQPTHKLWMLGNHQPKVGAGGYSFWRRMRQIPFTNVVPEQNRIDDLAEQLIEKEGAGILHWVIQGAVKYLNDGLTEPQEVLEATLAYEESEDHLRRFIEDRIQTGGGDYVRVPRRDMRFAYTDWCRHEGLKPMTANAFTREVQNRFKIMTAKSNSVWQYTNCTLLTDPEEPDSPNSPWNDLGGGTK